MTQLLSYLDLDSMCALFGVLELFEKASGLKLNVKKTEAMWIGSLHSAGCHCIEESPGVEQQLSLGSALQFSACTDTIYLAMPYLFMYFSLNLTRHELRCFRSGKFGKGSWQELQTFAVPTPRRQPLADILSRLGWQLRQTSDNKCFKQQNASSLQLIECRESKQKLIKCPFLATYARLLVAVNRCAELH